MTPHTDLIFFQVAVSSPTVWTDQVHDYVQIDAIWRVPHDGSAPEFYTPTHTWPDSHAGQLARLNKELALHIAENARRDETILAQARELRELRDQVAQLREQQQQPAEAPLATVAENCAHTERSLITPEYCFTHAAKRASTKPAPAAEPDPEPKKARMGTKPKLVDDRPDLSCPFDCGKQGMKTEHAIRVHIGHKHNGQQQPIGSDRARGLPSR